MNIFCRKLFSLQNHFLGNRFEPNIFTKNILVEFFYGYKIISSGIGLNQKLSSKSFWLRFFWLQNHFLGNRLEPKILIKIFLVENFYGCKIISWEIGFNKKFS